MTVLTWSDDRVEQLKKLWEAGLIGQPDRRGTRKCDAKRRDRQSAPAGPVRPRQEPLLGRPAAAQGASRRQQMMRVSRQVSRGNTALAHAFEVEMEADPIAFDNVVPMSQRLSLLELNEATCHWPVGDPSSPEFFFCGGKALSGLPYCAHHSRVAYQPASDRRRAAPKPTR